MCLAISAWFVKGPYIHHVPYVIAFVFTDIVLIVCSHRNALPNLGEVNPIQTFLGDVCLDSENYKLRTFMYKCTYHIHNIYTQYLNAGIVDGD